MYQAKETRYDKMVYNRCGNSGLKLPEVSLGFWHNFGDTGVYENMRQMVFTCLLYTSHRKASMWRLMCHRNCNKTLRRSVENDKIKNNDSMQK